jgi:hypothetical protein
MTTKNRDALPDYAERARRLGDLIAAPALPLADIALHQHEVAGVEAV